MEKARFRSQESTDIQEEGNVSGFKGYKVVKKDRLRKEMTGWEVSC